MVFSVIIVILSSDIGSRTADFVNAQKQLDTASAAIGSLAYLQVDAETAKKYLPQIASYLISKDQLLSFPKDINSIAQQNNMNFAVTFGNEIPITATSPRSTEITLSSQSQATMDNFINFMKLLENSPYFVKFNSIDISQDTNQQGANQLKAGLTGSVFSF